MNDVVTQNQVKSSIQRTIRAKILQTYPRLEYVINDLIPKKITMFVAKCHNHIQIAVIDNEPLFFQHRNGPWIPTLRVLHRYPTMMPMMRVDYGAVKFVLRGSNVMCPGITSPNGFIEPNVSSGSVVQILAEGKQHACGIGILTIDSNDIPAINKGVCIETLHTLGDGLWETVTLGLTSNEVKDKEA